MFGILITIISLLLHQALFLEEILTRNHTRVWYRNQFLPFNNSTNPYCKICCVDKTQIYRGRKCGIHTMCVYASRSIGPACRGLIVINFSQVEIDAIVDAHNTLRNRIALGLEQNGNPGPQPPAVNMRKISWDMELAKMALLWASQCVYAHDKCRDLIRFPVGQNLARGGYALQSDVEYVKNWYKWVEFSNENIIRGYQKEPDLDPFTQLLWADTYLVGCVRVCFQSSLNGQSQYQEHFICNYGPAGNIPKQPVYKIGEPCGECSDGTYCTDPEYPGLCGNEILNETDLHERQKMHRKLATNCAKLDRYQIGLYFVPFIAYFTWIPVAF